MRAGKKKCTKNLRDSDSDVIVAGGSKFVLLITRTILTSTNALLIMRIILTSTNAPVEKPVENLLQMRVILNKPYCN